MNDDKAARDALEKWYGQGPIDASSLDAFLAGYQAAHDAAMAAEPDARLVIVALKALDDPRVPSPTVGRDATAALESLLLRLQAAQQREAEYRKALTELVAWQDEKSRLCDAINAIPWPANPDSARKVSQALRDDIDRHAAQDSEVWAAARAALATQPTSKVRRREAND